MITDHAALSLIVGLNFILFMSGMGRMHRKNQEKEIKYKWSDLDNASSSSIPN